MTRCFSLTLFSIACLGCSGVDGSEKGIYIGGVPTEIHDLMNERGCSPIADFYARAVYLPPFIVERSPNLVAFVCQIDEPVGDDKYKLVIGERVRSNTESGFGFSSLDECSSEILLEHMPGGLSLKRYSGSPFLTYNRWEDTKNRLWSKKDVSVQPSWIIRELVGGAVGYGFFCIEGEWHHQSYH